MRHVIGKLKIWKNGEVLVGSVVCLAGGYIAWQGFTKVRELWVFFASFLPLAVPDDVGERLLASLPLISKVFINTVSALAAMLVGCAWALSGIGEAWQGGRRSSDPSDMQHPELVAELIRTGKVQYAKSSPTLCRLVGVLLPRVRLMSPISCEIMGNLLWSGVKVLLVALVIAGVWYLFHGIPSVVKAYFDRHVILQVPSAQPLFLLLGLVICVHVLTALSLIPFKMPAFVRTREVLSIRGSSDPNGFFALLEEGCKLLNAVGVPPRASLRLTADTNPSVKATLVETTPESLRSVGRSAGYVCLPLVFFPITMGFTRLIHFQRPVDSMPYQEFLTGRLLHYTLEVAFALGLIVVGLHFAELARRFFGVQLFRSALIVAFAESESKSVSVSEDLPHSFPVQHAEEMHWNTAHGADDNFANWVRAPHVQGMFTVHLFWAEALSESAGAGGPRFVVDLHNASDLDEAMRHIAKIPFHMHYQLALNHSVGDAASTNHEGAATRRT